MVRFVPMFDDVKFASAIDDAYEKGKADERAKVIKDIKDYLQNAIPCEIKVDIKSLIAILDEAYPTKKIKKSKLHRCGVCNYEDDLK